MNITVQPREKHFAFWCEVLTLIPRPLKTLLPAFLLTSAVSLCRIVKGEIGGGSAPARVTVGQRGTVFEKARTLAATS